MRIARKGIESRERLGRRRWVIERTMSWLTGYRRLNHRYERHPRNYLAFLGLAAALCCYKRLVRPTPPLGHGLSLDPPTHFRTDLLTSFGSESVECLRLSMRYLLVCPAFPRVFPVGPWWAGWAGGSGCVGWAVDGVEEVCPGVLPGPVSR